jgi:hypothetical protein
MTLPGPVEIMPARTALHKLVERYPDTRQAEQAERLMASFQTDATARR